MLKLDARDLKILSILQEEGRISKSELAKRVNLSNTPCWERLQRLEAAGIVRGYGSRIALEALAEHVTIFVTAELENHRSGDFSRFEEIVAEEKEIVACWALGGGLDYLFQVVTRSVGTYQQLIDRLLTGEAGLKRYFTYIVTKEVKSGGVPLEIFKGS